MGHTPFIVFRTPRTESRDTGAERPPQFAELTGAYWLEPIYTGLAREWSRQGRAVPGTAPRPRQRTAVDREAADRAEPERDTPERTEPEGAEPERADAERNTPAAASPPPPERA